jgi:hypothetical protein
MEYAEKHTVKRPIGRPAVQYGLNKFTQDEHRVVFQKVARDLEKRVKMGVTTNDCPGSDRFVKNHGKD